MYSNIGFTLLGIIVHRVSGMSLREFTTKSIFVPLGMTQTHFRDDHEEIIKHDALGYEQDGEDKPFRMNLTTSTPSGPPAWTRQSRTCSVGMRTSTTRAAVLCNLANTDPTALARQVADILLARELEPPVHARDSARASGAVMTGEQMATMVGVYWGREEDEFVTLRLKNGKLQINMGRGDFQDLKSFAPAYFHVANVSWGDNVDIHLVAADTAGARHVEETFVGEWPKIYESVAAFDTTAAELTEYPGKFVSQETEPVYRISFQAGGLTLLRLKHKPDMLRPVMRDVFVGEVDTVRFMRDAHVSGFILDAGRIQNFKFAKKCGT